VFARTIIGVVVCQLTAIGLFSLRNAFSQSTLLLPLPLLSAYFYKRCVDEFEPVTTFLPVEVSDLI
jgi:hypothetical protein